MISLRAQSSKIPILNHIKQKLESQKNKKKQDTENNKSKTSKFTNNEDIRSSLKQARDVSIVLMCFMIFGLLFISIFIKILEAIKSIKNKPVISPSKPKIDIIKNITAKEIYEKALKDVQGQEQAKRTISSAVSINLRNAYKKYYENNNSQENNIRKNNVLMIGSSGSGKTMIMEKISEYLGLPCLIVDSTTIVPAGIRGKTVNMLLEDLYIKAGKSKELAQMGIICFDEFDKIVNNINFNRPLNANYDIQSILLTLMHGSTFITGDTYKESIEIDTSNILIVCMGSFDRLPALIKEEQEKHENSFDFLPKAHKRDRNFKNNEKIQLLKEVKNNDSYLAKYGVMTEILGRLPHRIVFDNFTKEHFTNIVKNYSLPEAQRSLNNFNARLVWDDDVITKIVDKSFDEHTGVRKIQNIITEIIVDVQHQLPDDRQNKKKQKVTLSVEGNEIISRVEDDDN